MMKRVLIAVGVIVLLSAAAAAAVFVTTFMGRRAIEDGFEHRSVRIVADGFVSVGMVDIGEGHVTLIDGGNDEAGAAILAELRRRGLGADAVSAVLLTHGHPDHRAALAKFPSAVVAALAAEEPLIAGREAGKSPLARWFSARPTGITVRALSDGETFTLGVREFRVFAVPGHTAGSAAYLVDEMLFVGDSADTLSDGTLTPAAWIFSDDQTVNRASLVALDERLKRENVSVRAVVPGHSGPMTNGLAELDRFAAGER